MSCCHHYFTATEGGDDAFVVDASRVVFGAGALAEAGDHAMALGMKRVAVFTDKGVRGIAFGGAGCHIPHGMSYAVAGLVREYRPRDYPQEKAMVPHGMAVILNAPAVYRWTASGCPDRHLHGAECLSADVRGATPADAGEVVAGRIIEMMKATLFPNGLTAVGFGAADAGALAEGAFPQQRLLANSPRPVAKADLASLFLGAMRYW